MSPFIDKPVASSRTKPCPKTNIQRTGKKCFSNSTKNQSRRLIKKHIIREIILRSEDY
jgi:hypothetical protein